MSEADVCAVFAGSQSRLLRAGVAAIAAAVVSAALGGCGSASKTSRPPTAHATFKNGLLVVGYPTKWKPFVFRFTRTFHFAPTLYLASQPIHRPCRTQAASIVCGWPLSALRPGGALLVWENRGAPGWTLASVAGAVLHVGGREARQSVNRPGQCAAIRADETIEVEIARPLPNNWTAFTACLRGPGLAAAERDVRAVLASTRFVAP